MDFIPHQLHIAGKLLDLSTPAVMAIINVTPDSFYGLSRMRTEREVLKAVEKALAEGAAIIDVGAYSTRPGARHISEEQEWERLDHPLKAIQHHFPEAVVSLDTFRAGIARRAVENRGVKIINDIGGGTLDDRMFETVASLQVPYILTHTRGTPQTMSEQTDYENMMAEMLHFFENRTARLIHLGAKDILIDPGFGFAKTGEQNYELLAKMNYFSALGFPILCGISRKSMIYKPLDITPEEALNGTTALNMLGLLGGASLLRVHDVKPAAETIRLFLHYKQYQQIPQHDGRI